MSKKKHAKRKETSRSAPKPPAATKSSSLGWVLITLGVAGLLLTGYLTWLKLFGEHPAYCDAGSGCDLVQSSRWSMLLGVPLSAWGLLTYAILLVSLWRSRRRPSVWVFSLSIAGFGVGFSVYLTIISILEIRATCIYCLASFALISAIFVLLLLARPDRTRAFGWGNWAARCFGATGVLIVVLHMHYSGLFDPGAGPEDRQLKALAVHLETTGARFYGAFWCPRCQEQKAVFEASAARLPYVECTPSGRTGLRALACVNNTIERFPTWVIGERRIEGVLEPKVLASLSGFDWVASE